MLPFGELLYSLLPNHSVPTRLVYFLLLFEAVLFPQGNAAQSDLGLLQNLPLSSVCF